MATIAFRIALHSTLEPIEIQHFHGEKKPPSCPGGFLSILRPGNYLWTMPMNKPSSPLRASDPHSHGRLPRKVSEVPSRRPSDFPLSTAGTAHPSPVYFCLASTFDQILLNWPP